jgi:hypothetical protein
MKLMNGYEIAASGKVMMIPHGRKGMFADLNVYARKENVNP